MSRSPIIRRIGFPDIRLTPNSTIAIPISGRRLSGITAVEIVLVRGTETISATTPPEWLEIDESLLIVKYTVPPPSQLEGGAEPEIDGAELEITVTNDDGSDGMIYP